MKIGTYYEITDASRSDFENCETKMDWYEVMGRFGIGEGGLKAFDIDESVGTFTEGLSLLPKPLCSLFIGEFQTEGDTPDPNVSFLGRELVSEIAGTLRSTSDGFLDELVKYNLPPNGYSWLVIGLRGFFSEVEKRESAVVCMWE